jgi:hypothetical protein
MTIFSAPIVCSSAAAPSQPRDHIVMHGGGGGGGAGGHGGHGGHGGSWASKILVILILAFIVLTGLGVIGQ